MPAAKKPRAKKAAPTRPVNGEEVPYHQQPPSGKLPIPGEPPPLISNYEGKEELLREYPYYTVVLDAASFMWLWRIVESKALLHHQSATTRKLMPEQVEVAMHTATAFREAAGTVDTRLKDLSQGRKRVVKRV